MILNISDGPAFAQLDKPEFLLQIVVVQRDIPKTDKVSATSVASHISLSVGCTRVLLTHLRLAYLISSLPQ